MPRHGLHIAVAATRSGSVFIATDRPPGLKPAGRAGQTNSPEFSWPDFAAIFQIIERCVPRSAPMQEAVLTAPEEQSLIASDLSPGAAQKRLALAFALIIVAAFFVIIAISDNVPRPIPGFVLTFATAM